MKKYLQGLKERIRDNKQIEQEVEMREFYREQFKFNPKLHLMLQRRIALLLLKRQHRSI